MRFALLLLVFISSASAFFFGGGGCGCQQQPACPPAPSCGPPPVAACPPPPSCGGGYSAPVAPYQAPLPVPAPVPSFGGAGYAQPAALPVVAPQPNYGPQQPLPAVPAPSYAGAPPPQPAAPVQSYSAPQAPPPPPPPPPAPVAPAPSYSQGAPFAASAAADTIKEVVEEDGASTSVPEDREQSEEEKFIDVSQLKLTNDTLCNSEDLRALMLENIDENLNSSKRLIQLAAESQFGGRFDVICANGDFSYVTNTELYCQETKGDVSCYTYRQL